ncbi:MAG: asparagine synthase-related protein [Anaerolineales bacterium]
MAPASIQLIKTSFFIFGSFGLDAAPGLIKKIKAFGSSLKITQENGGNGYFFTAPDYIDLYEDEEMLWIKLGIAHDSSRCYATREMVQKGWLNQGGVQVEAFRGSVTLVGLVKQDRVTYVYRNLLSPINIRYRVDGSSLLLADNLRLLSYFLERAQPDQEVEVNHHIYRQVFGRRTYLHGVSNLLGGEMLTFTRGDAQLELLKDFSSYNTQGEKKLVTAETVAWFFDQLCAVVGFGVDGHEHQAATLLSGGVDSTTMQAAINSRPGVDFAFPTYSFLVDTPGFQFELDYAREASTLLGSEHTFLKVEPDLFRDWLATSVSILGQPVHFDAPPSYYAIAKLLAEKNPGLKYLFNGANADILTGNSRALELVQGDKYHSWPVWMLKVLAVVFKPFSPSKSFGAESAAETLSSLEDPNSSDYVFNRSSTCDWALVSSCFSKQEIDAAFNVNHDLLSSYSASNLIVEQRQLLSLLMDGMSTPSLERQLGLFCGREMLFPFCDDALVEAVFSFEPVDRYTHDYRVKPIMRMALESQIPSSVTRKPKGNSSVFQQAIVPWMKDGALKDLVQAIERPGYISNKEFKHLQDDPDWFTWNMLTWDLFKKHGIQ